MEPPHGASSFLRHAQSRSSPRTEAEVHADANTFARHGCVGEMTSQKARASNSCEILSLNRCPHGSSAWFPYAPCWPPSPGTVKSFEFGVNSRLESWTAWYSLGEARERLFKEMLVSAEDSSESRRLASPFGDGGVLMRGACL